MNDTIDLDKDAAFVVGQMVTIGDGGKVYRVWKTHPPFTATSGYQGRDHWLYSVEPAKSKHPYGAMRRPSGSSLFRAEQLRPA
jgi:hypothetical protein